MNMGGVASGEPAQIPANRAGCQLRCRVSCWCARGDLNSHGLPHWILSPARLPVSPLARDRNNRSLPRSTPAGVPCMPVTVPEIVPVAIPVVVPVAA